MNIGFWLCGVLVIPFVIIGVLFAIFKERAAKFVASEFALTLSLVLYPFPSCYECSQGQN